MTVRITPEMVATYWVDGVVSMKIPEGCDVLYVESFKVGFERKSNLSGLFALSAIDGQKDAYEDGVAARRYLDNLFTVRVNNRTIVFTGK